jgi:hypothetical protein
MAQQIKITQTSNADMNIGVPKNMTAVEWLFEQFFKVRWDSMQGNRPIIFNQAKQMEKDQIMKANMDGYKEACKYFSFGHSVKTTEEYYNQTYQSNKD